MWNNYKDRDTTKVEPVKSSGDYLPSLPEGLYWRVREGITDYYTFRDPDLGYCNIEVMLMKKDEKGASCIGDRMTYLNKEKIIDAATSILNEQAVKLERAKLRTQLLGDFS